MGTISDEEDVKLRMVTGGRTDSNGLLHVVMR
jgi:hypothetical protein